MVSVALSGDVHDPDNRHTVGLCVKSKLVTVGNRVNQRVRSARRLADTAQHDVRRIVRSRSRHEPTAQDRHAVSATSSMKIFKVIFGARVGIQPTVLYNNAGDWGDASQSAAIKRDFKPLVIAT